MCSKVMLKDLNPHIVCGLCMGYFIDPVTISECLHSFCKTCIVRHVETSKKCPICDLYIHKTRPHLNMRVDKTLQDVVYKLVPGLHEDEMKRREQFFSKHKPKGEQLQSFKEEKEKIFFNEEDKISLSIEYFEPNISLKLRMSKENKNRRFLKCPGMVKIKHLKKFVSTKYGLNEQFLVDVIYKEEIIPEEYTLIDVAYLYNWRKDRPMEFFYRIFKKNRMFLRKRKTKVMAKNENVSEENGNSLSKIPKMEDKSNDKETKLELKTAEHNASKGRVAAPVSSAPSSIAPTSLKEIPIASGKTENNIVAKSSTAAKSAVPKNGKDIDKHKLNSGCPGEKSEKTEVVELSVNVSASDVKKVVAELHKKEQNRITFGPPSLVSNSTSGSTVPTSGIDKKLVNGNGSSKPYSSTPSVSTIKPTILKPKSGETVKLSDIVSNLAKRANLDAEAVNAVKMQQPKLKQTVTSSSTSSVPQTSTNVSFSSSPINSIRGPAGYGSPKTTENSILSALPKTSLTKSIPSSTTVTVKNTSVSKAQEYANIGPKVMSQKALANEINKNGMIKLTNMTEALAKQKKAELIFSKSSPIHPLADGRKTPTMPQKPSMNKFPSPIGQLELNKSAKAALLQQNNKSSSILTSSSSNGIGCMASKTVQSPTFLTSTSQPLPPNNRLQLKVKETVTTIPLLKAPPLPPVSSEALQKLVNQAPVKDILWSTMNKHPETVHRPSLLSKPSATMVNLSKSLNQGIRQIPNPSLLTKQNQF